MALYDHGLEAKALAWLHDTSSVEGPSSARMELERAGLLRDLFHLPAHADLFEAIAGLIQTNQATDVDILAARLNGSGAVGGAGGRGWIQRTLPGTFAALPGALAGYVDKLRDLYKRRHMLSVAKQLAASANGTDDADEAIRAATTTLAGLATSRAHVRTVRELTEDVIAELDQVQAGKREPVVATGIDALDDCISGLQETLTIIGSLPGVGKSALIATMAQSLAKRGIRVGIFSLEDQGTWIPWRLIAAESGLDQATLRYRRKNEWQLTSTSEGTERVWKYGNNILVDDRSGLSPQQVVTGATDMVLNRGCQVIMVDHLGELRYQSGRKERFDLDVADGLSDLRGIAKRYRVPVVCCTHLKRDADARKEVRLSDFANSSAVERQARVALGLSREPGTGRLVVDVLKQTNGRAGVAVALDFHGSAALVKPTGGEEIKGKGKARIEHSYTGENS